MFSIYIKWFLLYNIATFLCESQATLLLFRTYRKLCFLENITIFSYQDAYLCVRGISRPIGEAETPTNFVHLSM